MKETHSTDNEVFGQFSRDVDLIVSARDAWVHALASDQPFDTSKPCRVCGETGHTFDDCELLKNITFLCKHITNSQMNSARNQRMTAKAAANQSREKINRLEDEAAAMEADEGEQEMAFDDDNTEVVDNTHPDFH